MIHVLTTYFDTELEPRNWKKGLYRVPQSIQTKIRRYIRWQDQVAVLYGKLLLQKGLSFFGRQEVSLAELMEGAYGRPQLPGTALDFNISHSGGCVVCALATSGRIGIDVERIRPLRWNEFKSCFTPDEQVALSSATDHTTLFFDLWTRKESVLKADGRGLSVPMDLVAVSEAKTTLSGQTYCLTELDMVPGYRCSLATTFPVDGICLTIVHSEELISLQSMGNNSVPGRGSETIHRFQKSEESS